MIYIIMSTFIVVVSGVFTLISFTAGRVATGFMLFAGTIGWGILLGINLKIYKEGILCLTSLWKYTWVMAVVG